MYVRVRVTPSAKKETVTRVSENELHICVREPAARNLANRRVGELVAQALGVDVRDVRMLAGHRSQSKMFSVEKI